VGRFHQWLSLFMAVSAAALSLVAILHWARGQVTGLRVLNLSISLAVAWSDARKLCAVRKDE
jgi:hypothetical protein